jgi:hypothetical protein
VREVAVNREPLLSTLSRTEACEHKKQVADAVEHLMQVLRGTPPAARAAKIAATEPVREAIAKLAAARADLAALAKLGSKRD